MNCTEVSDCEHEFDQKEQEETDDGQEETDDMKELETDSNLEEADYDLGEDLEESLGEDDDDEVGEDDDEVGEDDDEVGEDDDELGEDDDGLGEDDDGLGEDDDGLGEDDDGLGEDDDGLGEDDESNESSSDDESIDDSSSDSADDGDKYGEEMFEPIYPGAHITVCGAFCAIMEFKKKCRLSFQTIGLLLQLLQLICPSENKLPRSVYYIKKFFSQFAPKHQQKKFCSICCTELHQKKCTNCGCKNHDTNYLVDFNIEKALQSVVNSKLSFILLYDISRYIS